MATGYGIVVIPAEAFHIASLWEDYNRLREAHPLESRISNAQLHILSDILAGFIELQLVNEYAKARKRPTTVRGVG